MTLGGSGFNSSAVVQIGGINCNSTVVNTGGSISCNLPTTTDGASAGVKDVSVQNPDAQSDTLANAFTYRTAQGYSTLVVGVIANRCSGCHTGGGSSGGLSLDVYASAAARTTAFDPSNSLLINRLNGVGGIMPPGGAISASEIQEFSDWILDGAQNN